MKRCVCDGAYASVFTIYSFLIAELYNVFVHEYEQQIASESFPDPYPK